MFLSGKTYWKSENSFFLQLGKYFGGYITNERTVNICTAETSWLSANCCVVKIWTYKMAFMTRCMLYEGLIFNKNNNNVIVVKIEMFVSSIANSCTKTKGKIQHLTFHVNSFLLLLCSLVTICYLFFKTYYILIMLPKFKIWSPFSNLNTYAREICAKTWKTFETRFINLGKELKVL